MSTRTEPAGAPARVFVALSTGQNVANIAPILATATPRDQVVLVSTDEASRRGWTAAARKVLARHDFSSIDVLSVATNSPSDIWQAIFEAYEPAP